MTKQLCSVCKTRPIVFYVQVIAGDFVAYFPGYHIRGFPITKVCSQCKDELKVKFKREGSIA